MTSFNIGLNGWHPGERAMHRKMGHDKTPGHNESWQYISGRLPQQHARFHTSNLHFLPIVTLDENGRPWSSILAGQDGNIGWVKNLPHSKLELSPRIWEGDPFWENSDLFVKPEDNLLIAGIGVEVSTRRRNKLAGRITALKRNERNRKITFEVEVNEATGNCPKYIVVRALEPYPQPHPSVVYNKPDMSPDDRLPSDIISYIQVADTLWLGSAYLVDPAAPEARLFPSHLGINHRGGRPGWVRVKPSDGRTLVLADYSGNRWMTSLGNIEYTPLASIAIADFKTGDVLYLTGEAKNLQGKDAEDIMPTQKALTTLRVTGYRFVKDALPVRQEALSPREEVEVSPYSPPVKLLREEIELKGGASFFVGSDASELPKATVEKIEFHSPNIATFTFRPSVSLQIRPGQAIILDFKELVGSPQYRHMAEGKPSLVNDDFIRTWTVSSYHAPVPKSAKGEEVPSEIQTFDMTMKEKPGGIITGALFNIARGIKEKRPELLEDMKALDIHPGIIGVSGEFYLDTEESETYTGPTDPRLDLGLPPPSPRRLVWGAGGIGVTPFLTMLRAISSVSAPGTRGRSWDIVFILSTREPEVLLPIIEKAYPSHLPDIRMHLHVFTTRPVPASAAPFEVHVRQERLAKDWFKEHREELAGREGYVCGTREFEEVFINSLVNDVGIEKEKVRKEGFAY